MKKLLNIFSNSKGLTVLELLVALSLLTFIIGGGYVVMNHGYKLFSNTKETANTLVTQKVEMPNTGISNVNVKYSSNNNCLVYEGNETNWNEIRKILKLSSTIPANTKILIKGDLYLGNGNEILGANKDTVEIYVEGSLLIDSGSKVMNVTVHVKENFDHSQGGHIGHNKGGQATVYVNGEYSPHSPSGQNNGNGNGNNGKGNGNNGNGNGNNGKGNGNGNQGGSQGVENVFVEGDEGFIPYQAPNCSPKVCFLDNDSFDSLLEINPNQYPVKNLPKNQCEVTGDTQFTNSNFAGNFNWTPCNHTMIKDGSLYFPNGLGFNNQYKLTVEKDLFVTKTIGGLNNGAEIDVRGNALFSNDFSQNGAKISVKNNFFAKGGTQLNTGSSLNIGGSSRFDKKLVLNNQSQITTGCKLFITSSELTLNSNSSIIANGDAEINSKLTMNNTSNITINGNLHLSGSIIMNSGSTITVEGDAKFDNSTSFLGNNNSKIIVKGTVTIGNKVYKKNFEYKGINFIVG